MAKYKVKIVEILEKIIEVEAICEDDATDVAYKEWQDAEHILSADEFVGVEFYNHRDIQKT